MRNVAAKQLADDPVHVDCRRNSLPFILSSKSLAKEQVSCEEKIEKTQTNTSDVKMLNTSRIQETKEQNSIVPSTTQRFLQKGIENYDCNASQDAMMKVQKSLSDSNVYQRSVNNNVRVRREARIKDEALFNKIAHEQNPLMKSTKINSFIENYEIDYYDTDKDISELKITSASSINQLNCDLKRRYLHVCNEQNSSRYSDIYKNDRLIEEGVSTLEKNEDIYNFQAHNYVNEKEKPKIIVDPERCMKKTIDFLGNPNEHHILMNKTNTFDNCNSTDKINIQTNENHKEINALHEPKKDIPARKVESHDMQQYSIPEIPNLKIHSETDTLNAKDISSKKSEIFKNPEIQLHNMPAVSVTDALNAEDISSKKSETFKNPEIQLHNMPAVSVTDTLNAEDISSKKSETFKNPEIQIHNMPAVSVSERKYSTSRFLEDNIQRAVLSDVVYENKPSNESSQQNAEFSQSTPNTNDQQHVNRRHRANSENKYVSDESELKLNFTRRRIRPSSAIYEGNPVLECSKELETRMFSKYLSSHSLEKKAVPGNFQNIPVSCLSDELLQPPPGEPPSGYCLPSRRRRYRRAVTSSITDS